jgi:DNA-binding transcriptional regulator YiaG
MATDKPRVAAYISQPIYEALEKFCFDNNLTQKDRKTNSDRPNLSKAIEIILDKALEVGDTLHSTSGLSIGNIPQTTDSTLIDEKIREQIETKLSLQSFTQKEALANLTQRLSLIEDNLEKMESLNLKQKVEELEERISTLPSNPPVEDRNRLFSIPVGSSDLPFSLPVDQDSNLPVTRRVAKDKLPSSTLLEDSNLPSNLPVDTDGTPDSLPSNPPVEDSKLLSSTPVALDSLPASLHSNPPVATDSLPDNSLGSVPTSTPVKHSPSSRQRAKETKEALKNKQTHQEVTSAVTKPSANEPKPEESIGITNAELARRLGVNKSAISRWKSGERSPANPKVAARFAQWEFKNGAWYLKVPNPIDF